MDGSRRREDYLIELRSPRENGYYECLNERLFSSYRHARDSIEEWRIDYNVNRPPTSLDGLTPNEFANRSRSDHNVNRSNL